MEKININTIFDLIYYGTDMEFKYKEKFYFFSSGWSADEKRIHSITVYISSDSFYEPEKENIESKIIFQLESENANDNVNELFDAKIFEDKNLYEIIEFIKTIES